MISLQKPRNGHLWVFFQVIRICPVLVEPVSEMGQLLVEKPCFSEGLLKQPDLVIRDTALKYRYRESDNTKDNSLVDMEYTQTCSKQKHNQIIRDTQCDMHPLPLPSSSDFKFSRKEVVMQFRRKHGIEPGIPLRTPKQTGLSCDSEPSLDRPLQPPPGGRRETVNICRQSTWVNRLSKNASGLHTFHAMPWSTWLRSIVFTQI